MKRKYSSFYRSCLSSGEKNMFRKLAQKKGSVVDVHDELLREFIKKELEEGENGTQDTRAQLNQRLD